MRRWVEHAQFRGYLHCSQRASQISFINQQSLISATSTQRHNVSRFASRSLSTARVWYQDAAQPASQGLSSDLSKAQKPTEAVTRDEHSKKPKPGEENHEYWIALLEKYLPNDLNLSFQQGSRTVFDRHHDAQDVLEVLQTAQRSKGLDILTYMVLNQHRHKAVIYLANKILEPAQNGANQSTARDPPSNILWPSSPLSELSKAPIDLAPEAYVRTLSPAILTSVSHGREGASGNEAVMHWMWPMLANLVIASLRLPAGEAKQIMHTVHQIIARVHHVGLVPASVYTYATPQAPTTIQYPPVLSLLSTRILSTLSDTVWRASQDEEISRLLKEGKTHKDLLSDVPGSRFRLKIRDLAPAVWVEFILWCCVEGGFASAGARIIQALRRDPDHTWSAIHWTIGGHGTENEIPQIDWEQVKPNYGGSTAGPIEGYSRDKSSVEKPATTISAEVVLALVDCLINSIDQRRADEGLAVADVQDEISDVVAFLEPHGLAPGYFDYLAVRVLQTENFRLQTSPHALATWASTVSVLRTLDRAKTRRFGKPGLRVDYILEHSALEAGILHQCLQRYVETNLTTKAVSTLTLLQKQVDASKLEAIGEFLSLEVRPRDGFFTSRPTQRHTEFINSHGQLPEYKLPLVINMATKARLFGLSDWLLYSSDIDGPVVPVEVHGRPSIAIALSHHAAAKDDIFLMKSILAGSGESRRKPTVNLLRALVNAQIHFRAWDDVHFLLQRLKRSEAGGYSPGIIANLAAEILRLGAEPERQQQEHHSVDTDLHKAEELLDLILSGRYDAPKADFNIFQRKTFGQQVGFLLRFLEDIPNSRVRNIAASHIHKFPVSNSPNLDLDTFHAIFSAVVEVKGALEGRRMWEIFCQQPSSPTLTLIDNDGHSQNPRIGAEENKAHPLSRQGMHSATAGESSKEAGSLSENTNVTLRARLDESAESGEVPLPDDSIRISPIGSIDLPLWGQHFQSSAMLPAIATHVEDPSSDIPFESTIPDDTAQDNLMGNPIVAPDLHTLQILVRGALADKQSSRALPKETDTELDDLLAWAANVGRTFGLSSEDIQRELNIPAVFHDALVLPMTFRARLRRSYKRSYRAMDVASYFTRGVLGPKHGYLKRVESKRKR
ncbi:hypothetical protein PV11_06865 [Exophiala sideris]|uniref:Uncharacterized protein n=1 Tax=Exophiala sideris TaxID=1016849 RepID=A0A0D1YWU5_9EURO|nr:hypothetical protein PV11_06865 [Exophiala sideris]